MEPYDPSDLVFSFRIREDGSGIYATAHVSSITRDTTSGLLEPGATLSVNGTPLQFDDIRYQAEVAPAPAYVFVFTPAGGPAFRSSVDAPPPARILYPTQGAQISRSGGFIARWDTLDAGPATTHDLELDLGITCQTIARVRNVLEERYPFNPDQLIQSLYGNTGSAGRAPVPSCDGVIARSLLFIYARNVGTMDPALTGDINAVVQTSVLFLTVP